MYRGWEVIGVWMDVVVHTCTSASAQICRESWRSTAQKPLVAHPAPQRTLSVQWVDVRPEQDSVFSRMEGRVWSVGMTRWLLAAVSQQRPTLQHTCPYHSVLLPRASSDGFSGRWHSCTSGQSPLPPLSCQPRETYIPYMLCLLWRRSQRLAGQGRTREVQLGHVGWEGVLNISATLTNSLSY